MKPPVIIIAALSVNRVIGSGTGLPWHVPEDYQNFLDLVRDQAIVMGRTSYEIFGPDLTTRFNYVLTSTASHFQEATSVHDLPTAIQQASRHGVDVFIGGGARVYAASLALADRMYLSWIPGEFSGDTFFPDFDPAQWRINGREDRGSYEFVDYRRVVGVERYRRLVS